MSKPPKVSLRFLRWFCRPELLKYIEGDLIELFEENLEQKSLILARLLFVWEVLKLFRPGIIRPCSGTHRMSQLSLVRHNVITSVRHLRRNKFFASINLIGIVAGLMTCLVIMLWVEQELSYDSFHEDSDRMYRLSCNAEDFHTAVGPGSLAGALHDNFSFIESTVRVRGMFDYTFEIENRRFEESRVIHADQNFFQEFSFKLLKGNENTLLMGLNQIAISSSTAVKFFGSEDVIGKVIRESDHDLVVSGVFEDIPSNSHLRFDVVMPLYYEEESSPYDYDGWDMFGFMTYFKVYPRQLSEDELASINERMIEVFEANVSSLKVDFNIEPIRDIHLYKNLQFDIDSGGSIVYLRALSVIAILILLIAGINYNNLSIAHYLSRWKGIKLRKTIGASTRQLKAYFILESLVYATLSMLIALLGTFLFLPYFNSILETNLALDFTSPVVVWCILGLLFFVGIGGGIYPAITLTRVNTVQRPESSLYGRERILDVKNVLVGFQFLVSVCLISSGIIMQGQINMILDKDLGFDQDQLAYFKVPHAVKPESLESHLFGHSLLQTFAYSSSIPVDLKEATHGVDWEGKDSELQSVIPEMEVDCRFAKVFGLQLLNGRFFEDKFSEEPVYMINRAAAELMGFTVDEAVGKWLDNVGKGKIVGVFENFHFKSLHHAVEPIILTQVSFQDFVTIRIASGQITQTVELLEATLKDLDTNAQLDLRFVDKDIERQYQSEQKIKWIFSLFMTLSILISSLGVIGLTAYTVNRRIKEIGIRKVLGASRSVLIRLLSGKFAWLFAVAFTLAVPFVSFIMRNWLNGYAYHIDVSVVHFALAFLGSILLIGGTIVIQLINATEVNPVNLLRDE